MWRWCAGGATAAADWNTAAEQPAGADVAAVLRHARHLPGQDGAPEKDVLHDLGQSMLTKLGVLSQCSCVEELCSWGALSC